jgi:hypothetical protein
MVKAAALFRGRSIHPAYIPIDDGYWTAAPNPHLNEEVAAARFEGTS